VFKLLEKFGATPKVPLDEPPLPTDADVHQYDELAISHWLGDRHPLNLLWTPGNPGCGRSLLRKSIRWVLPSFALSLQATFIFAQTTNTNTVIPYLACQLAASDLSFRRFLSSSLASDPSILRQGLRSQFKHLIITPFRYMTAAVDFYPSSRSLDCHNEDRVPHQTLDVQR
jgi:hypothetical protein